MQPFSCILTFNNTVLFLKKFQIILIFIFWTVSFRGDLFNRNMLIHWPFVRNFKTLNKSTTLTFTYSFIQAISIAPLQVHYYSEALPTQHGYCVGVSCWSATGKCELRTCPRYLHVRGGWNHYPSDQRRRLYRQTHAPQPLPTTSTYAFLTWKHIKLFWLILNMR